MSSIGNVTQLLQPAVIPAPAPAPAQAITTAAAVVASGAGDQVHLTNVQAENQAIQSKAPVATTGTFALFTVGGVLYTRQTQRNSDGSVRVTYVPQYPGISSGVPSGGVDIKA